MSRLLGFGQQRIRLPVPLIDGMQRTQEILGSINFPPEYEWGALLS
jgi:hypothetical protein